MIKSTGIIPPALAAGALCLCALLFPACYTLKQGAALAGYLSAAVPLEKLDTSNAETAAFVERVRDIRAFARNELGLNDTKNYTRYVDINRDYLAAVVSACDAVSFTPHEWSFPIVGRVPYKGFFNPDDARAEAAKLKARGLDVWVRGVDAFSTLGFFRDPLYSYMRDYSEYELADLLIHELFHATVFLKNEVQFNEELAEFIGSAGARLYIESRYGSGAPQLAGLDARKKESAAFVAYVQKIRAQLDGVYKSDIPREQKLERKAVIIEESQRRFATEYNTLFTSGNYRYFETLALNNAYLELYALYYEGSSYLQDLYARSGSDLPAFIRAARRIKPGRARPSPRAQLEQELQAAP